MSNTIKLLILIQALFACIAVFGQQSSEKKELVIPIVKYNPYDFVYTIRKSFSRMPYVDYIKVVESNNKKHYYLNTGTGEEEIHNTKYFGFSGLNNAMQTDSLFLLYFVEQPTSLYKGLLPINYYGIIENDEIIFYKNKEGDNQKL